MGSGRAGEKRKDINYKRDVGQEMGKSSTNEKAGSKHALELDPDRGATEEAGGKSNELDDFRNQLKTK